MQTDKAAALLDRNPLALPTRNPIGRLIVISCLHDARSFATL